MGRFFQGRLVGRRDRRCYPLSEEVCGAVDGERRRRAVEVQDRSERSERSEASEEGLKR